MYTETQENKMMSMANVISDKLHLDWNTFLDEDIKTFDLLDGSEAYRILLRDAKTNEPIVSIYGEFNNNEITMLEYLKVRGNDTEPARLI